MSFESYNNIHQAFILILEIKTRVLPHVFMAAFLFIHGQNVEPSPQALIVINFKFEYDV